eukprot:TRINITY_DN60044_c0_g2_i1.p1 TRINITY_DN60044_c0_g2~~TRINITY_DN60044_c0_g2_i1.p1  ORF type:complete len:127 (+),score=30.75 TRINITY_DN60044_c0_g2_i1:54-434(+)
MSGEQDALNLPDGRKVLPKRGPGQENPVVKHEPKELSQQDQLKQDAKQAHQTVAQYQKSKEDEDHAQKVIQEDKQLTAQRQKDWVKMGTDTGNKQVYNQMQSKHQGGKHPYSGAPSNQPRKGQRGC